MSDYLPPEVLNKIIIRLPVKSLLRCTSVCKSWYSLITSPKFIATHLNHRNNNSNNQILISNFDTSFEYSIHRDGETFDKLSTLEFPLPGFFRIIGSSNGLVCMDKVVAVDHMETVFLWNPSVRKYVTLPTPSVTFDSHGHYQQTLGFGFHSATNDYKVVRVIRLLTHIEIQPAPKVELYELSTGCWRNINAGDFKYIVDVRDTQAFLNGVIHWTGHEYDGIRNLIVSFDMENEVLGAMMVPHSLQQGSPLRVAVYRDSLSLTEHKFSSNDCHCCIWVMQEYGIAKSWTKQFTIDLNKGFLKDPFGFRENGNALLATLPEKGLRGDMVSYDPKSKQIKNLGISGCICDFDKHTYVESLVLLRGLSDVLGRQESSCNAVALEGVSFLRKEDDESQGKKRMKR